MFHFTVLTKGNEYKDQGDKSTVRLFRLCNDGFGLTDAVRPDFSEGDGTSPALPDISTVA